VTKGLLQAAQVLQNPHSTVQIRPSPLAKKFRRKKRKDPNRRGLFVLTRQIWQDSLEIKKTNKGFLVESNKGLYRRH